MVLNRAYCTKPGESLIAQISLEGVNTLDHHVEAQVELLAIDEERVVDVSLDKEIMRESGAGQVGEFADQKDAIATAAFRGFRDEGLRGVFADVLFELKGLVRQEEGGRREGEVVREETLQSTQDHAQHVLSREMLAKVVTDGDKMNLHP